jgi:hypothetical protein
LLPTEDGEDIQLMAANNQAELMCWHYQLGYLIFPKLKQLVLNGEILKKLAKVLPPKCTGCLFGAMTKLPWQGKESKADHKVFIITKPGECISVNQMTPTEVGFYAQLKGNSPRSATSVSPCLMTISAISALFTFKSTVCCQRHLLPSLPLSSTWPNTE